MTGYRTGYDFLKWHAASRRSQRRRRWTKWLLAVSVPGVLLWLVGESALDQATHFGSNSLLPLMVPMIVATNLSPFARDTWLTARGLRGYDEFEREALTRATTRAYLVLILAITAGLLLLAGRLSIGGHLTITPWLLIRWATGFVSCTFALPVLIAEWTVPMPDAEDQPL